MSETFCQICRHPTPGHEPGCPVGTGEPVRGVNVWPFGINPQDFPQGQVQGQLGQMGGGPSTHGGQYLQGDPPFQGELTIIWKTEKEELIRRIADLERRVDGLEH